MNDMRFSNPSALFMRVIALGAILMLFFTLGRVALAMSFIPVEMREMPDFVAMWIMGARLDLRVACMAMLGFIVLYALWWAFARLALKISCAKIIARIFSHIVGIYAFLLGFIVVFGAFVAFYYFRAYGGKIDVFIFGLKDDDTRAILGIIWRDYPVIWGLIIALIGSAVTYIIFKIPFRHIRLPMGIIGRTISVFAYIALICGLVIGARGSLGTFPLKENNYSFSTHAIFNHIAANPLIALVWAHSNYKKQDKIPAFNPALATKLEKSLFTLAQTTEDSAFLRENPPHIVLVLMEGFGSNILAYDNPNDFDLLGRLRPHFASDMVFYRFLSSANFTAPSFMSLFFDSPFGNLAIGAHKNTHLNNNPFEIYANAGYSVVFITSGYASWYNLGIYTAFQGAHSVYDAVFLTKHYPQSAQDLGAYGISDEWAYKLAFETLSNAKKPTFIAMLTTSNHPPYHLSRSYAPSTLTPSPALTARLSYDDIKKSLLSLSLYRYANNAFGEFMDGVKGSALRDRTIIAATGDHHYRDITKIPAPSALNYAVPLYLYIPTAYKRDISYNPLTIGSHKDIFPTLYHLSLSNTHFTSTGGRNLLASNATNRAFGYNTDIWIDEVGLHAGDKICPWEEDEVPLVPLLPAQIAQYLHTKDCEDSAKTSFVGDYEELARQHIAQRVLDK